MSEEIERSGAKVTMFAGTPAFMAPETLSKLIKFHLRLGGETPDMTMGN